MITKSSTKTGVEHLGSAWYTVAILVVAFALSFVDRMILALLVDPIRADLGLSDTQIGLLQGFAFAIFYVVAGLAIARLADRHSRRTIIGIGVFFWSIMTATCGLTRNFLQLFLARVGVAVGEAALSPAAFSIIGDSFPREKLGRAIGVYTAGGFLGIGLAFLAGGAAIQLVSDASGLEVFGLGKLQPWQLAFMVVGLPGILVAALLFTVKEPTRRGMGAEYATKTSIREAAGFAAARWRVFLGLFVGFALINVPIATIASWVPTYFIRVLGYTPPDTARILGLIVLVLSPAGVVSGGWFMDRLHQRGVNNGHLRIGLAAAALLFPLGVLTTLMPRGDLVLILFGFFVYFGSVSLALAPAAIQVITPNQLRAQMSGIWLLSTNLITAGLGPTAIGVVTDRVFADDMAVGQSISLVNGVAVPLAALFLWSAWHPLKKLVAEQSVQSTS